MKLDDGYLYPPPKKSDQIVALVVEKKGDETRTSMRQSEIYAFSPNIRIRDGYMVMPKYHWSSFTEGDWFLSNPLYAVDRFNRQGDERELSNIVKIDSADYSRLKIPPTKFERAILKIKCPFVFGPTFIRNRETRNSYGAYRKLYVMNMGQGFVHNSKPEYNLDQNKSYIGIFEFRAKENGAVNFAHRSEIRDHTNHVLERDSMWELTKVLPESLTMEMENELRKSLDTLFESAKEYQKELEVMGAYGGSFSLLETPNNVDIMTSITRSFSLSQTSKSPDTSKSQSSSLSSIETPGDETLVDDTLTHDTDIPVFYTEEELEAYRMKVIVLITCLEKGVEIKKWRDNETGDMSIEDDYLIYKFHSRHSVTQKPEQKEETTEIVASNPTVPTFVAPKPVNQNSTVPRTIAHIPSSQPTLSPSIRNRTMSESSIRSNSLGIPLASSTPRPSPEPQRRNATVVIPANQDDSDAEEFGETVNQTSDTFLMCLDNNANPIRENNRYRRS